MIINQSSFILLNIFLLISLSNTYGQHLSQYRSEGFEKNGLNEYVSVVGGHVVHYWTSQNPKKIELLNKGKLDNPHTLLVSFHNTKSRYRITVDYEKRKLLCKHPDGREQWFEELPVIYRSEGFEKPGIVEYIEPDETGRYFYFTNLPDSKKIELKLLKSDRFPLEVSFPGDDEVYLISFGEFSLICVHPEGGKQIFDFYEWDKELK